MVPPATGAVARRPADPVGAAAADALADVLAGATVALAYAPEGAGGPPVEAGPGVAAATAAGPAGWCTTLTVALDERVARVVGTGPDSPLGELLATLPAAALRAAARFRSPGGEGPAGDGAVPPALRRALRDTVAAEVLAAFLGARVGREPPFALVAETVEFLIELSGTRVESHDLTHGVIVADVLRDEPRLEFAYPGDVRAAKRAPLLFDGQRSLLVVDPEGRARTELQRHRVERLAPHVGAAHVHQDDSVEAGSLVAAATGALGGLGFFVRADRSIWTFVDGRPLLVRRGEHWTAFPVELTSFLANLIGGGAAADLVARAAFMISSAPGGAIVAIVDHPSDLDEVVSPKDRYDRRDDLDVPMRPETRLHHLIDAEDLDEQTLVRLAQLDGATVVDRDGRLLAYGAIVTTADSQHEGARTAAAKTLSETARVVLKVSVDGDITVFAGGAIVATLLGRPAEPGP